MENENKDLQGVENENTLTPEERVQEDIRSKIADAAEEVKDEIQAAEQELVDEEIVEEELIEDTEYDEDAMLEYSDFEAEEEFVKPEPVKITIKKNSFIVSLICSAVFGALILFLGMQIPNIIKAIPEGKTVATVNGQNITDLDVNYYIYTETAAYAQENGISQEDVAAYDWNQETEDGIKLSEFIKEKALKAAISEAITIQKGAENGITLSEQEESQIEAQINGISSSYGEDGFTLRARTMGISSPKQYEKMYKRVMLLQNVQADIDENKENYYPEDLSVLNDYATKENASVKHILIKFPEDANEEAKAEKKALADSILERAKAGEDFDALVAEFNEDPGATEAGYTFGPGEMDFAFEVASFNLGIDQISEVVESSYGYHIIKRIPGMYELQAYWEAEAEKDIKIKNGRVKKLDITAVLTDVQDAINELSAETAQAK